MPERLLADAARLNHRRERGGGVGCYEGSSPTITSCLIEENFGADASGLYFTDGCTAQVVDCVIRANVNGGIFFPHHNGGSVLCRRSSPTFTNCTITGNWGSVAGGFYCGDNSAPTLTGCTIADNRADRSPSGLTDEEGSAPALTNCSITGNETARSGGGVYCAGGSSPTLADCTITGGPAGRRAQEVP